jgi:hypothetical protein
MLPEVRAVIILAHRLVAHGGVGPQAGYDPADADWDEAGDIGELAALASDECGHRVVGIAASL